MPSLGKANPASTNMMSSPYSNTQVFLPISCRPPKGITRRWGGLVALRLVPWALPLELVMEKEF